MSNLKKDIERICKLYNIVYDDSLSEDFIREFKDEINWNGISFHQKLSEDFIKEFQNKVNWGGISFSQILSEGFIKEFKDKVDWLCISRNQKLSEEFMREFKDRIDWNQISSNQILSEEFIREFKDKVDWYFISRDQMLSEDFIREFKDKVDWYLLFRYQKLSKQFRKEFNLKIPQDCWLYKPVNFKKKYIKENTDYEIVDNKYIIAYKSVRKDNRSVYFPAKYKYEVGKEYTSNCNYNINKENSFGLSAWTKEEALGYYSKGKLLKVKIAIKDIGAIVYDLNKIRCTKFEILEEVR
jgi:hypothetical protein